MQKLITSDKSDDSRSVKILWNTTFLRVLIPDIKYISLETELRTKILLKWNLFEINWLPPKRGSF